MLALKVTTSRRGFTLIELLVVIAIIAILIALLVPAVQQVREAANFTQCTNNCKQMALGVHSHHDSHGCFPSGGWGWQWIGDPNRVAVHQPGGWPFSILPFVEQEAIFRQTMGLTNAQAAQAQAIAAQQLGIPLPIYVCPSRRNGGPYGFTSGAATYFIGLADNTSTSINSPTALARADYAAVCGDVANLDENTGGPGTLAGEAGYGWSTQFTGVIYQHSQTRFIDITRGTSNTYLLGEKYVNPLKYFDGSDGGDNEAIYVGMDNDNCRDTGNWPPMQDTPGLTNAFLFGSAHAGGFNMAMCDGSVQRVAYGIDQAPYQNSGNRTSPLP